MHWFPPRFLRFSSFLFLLAAAPSLPAQSLVRVSGTPCTSCTIEKRVVLRLPGRVNEMISPYTILARDSRGRWLLSTIEIAPSISVYDSTGILLQNFSRRGEGPGEHSRVSVMAVTRGDTVHLFDNALRRHTVFSPSYQYVRSSSYPGRIWQAGELDDGTLVVNGDLPTPDRVGFPLHRMNQDGSLRESFGAEGTGYRMDASHLLARYIAHAGGDQVWQIPWAVYQPTLWSPDRKVTHVQRDAAWFPPVQTQRSPGGREPPTPWVHGIWLDNNQLLWTMLRVPDANWAPGPGAQALRPDQQHLVDFNREYDTLIEVIDARTGRLIAAQRFDEALWKLLPGGYVTWYREDPNGEPHLEIWQLMVSTTTRR